MNKLHVDADISKAHTLDKSFYSDETLFKAAREKIFLPSWQIIPFDEPTAPGDLIPFTLLGDYIPEPLLLSKDESGNTHCLSNVCTHRGNILCTDPTHSKHIRCRYHGRLFELDGKFRSMPEFKEVKDFPSANDNLTELPIFKWGNWQFISLEKKSNASLFLKDMMKRLEWLPVNEFVHQPSMKKEFIVKANWALYCENYLEGFHIPFVHAGLNAVIDFGNYTTELYEYSSLQLGIAKESGEVLFELPESSPDHGKKVAAYYYFVFPNMMFNFYPWGLSLNIVEPINVAETKVIFHTWIWKEELHGRGAGSDLDTVEMEDEEVVEQVNKGVGSILYPNGRYSVTREQGTHHFHRLIAQFMQ